MSRIVVPTIISFCVGSTFYVRDQYEIYTIMRETEEYRFAFKDEIRLLKCENANLKEKKL